MKKGIAILAICALLALGGQAFGQTLQVGQCTIDAVPAATLLLPHFKVDFAAEPGAGVTTLFSVNNASAAAAVAHVTLWTNWSVPTLDFDIYLTGYDVQSVNLYSLFANGDLPITAHADEDPTDTISPNNMHPTWDPVGLFPNCDTNLPFPSGLNANLLARIQNGHTGQAGIPGFPADQCLGYPTDYAEGYITIDNVNDCNLRFPSDPGYFVDGGLGDASNVNQLWGDYFHVDPANDFAYGDNLVSIEAFDCVVGSTSAFCDPLVNPLAPVPAWAAGDYTFYGRYPSGLFTAEDNREPTATTFASRYLSPPVFDDTKLGVWRDSKLPPNPSETCLVGPSWFPLNETQVVAFDEEEWAEELCFIFGGGFVSPPEDPSDPTCFPLESQWITVGEGDLDPSHEFGWLYLNLNTSTGAPVDPTMQNWVVTSLAAQGRYTVGYAATQLGSACFDANVLIDIDD
jgi:hypothetical protein